MVRGMNDAADAAVTIHGLPSSGLGALDVGLKLLIICYWARGWTAAGIGDSSADCAACGSCNRALPEMRCPDSSSPWRCTIRAGRAGLDQLFLLLGSGAAEQEHAEGHHAVQVRTQRRR